jgi:hypothetical protein
LPYGNRAKVDVRKLRDYCLNPDNPRGRHKARVFAAVLGLTANDAEKLRLKLLEIARTEQAIRGELDRYGERYTIDFEMETKPGPFSTTSTTRNKKLRSIPTKLLGTPARRG